MSGIQGLKDGEADACLAAGCNLMQLAGTTIAICQLGTLSPAGRCRTFDTAADGYGRGEGIAVAVLQPADSANALAVLSSSAVNQVGDCAA